MVCGLFASKTERARRSHDAASCADGHRRVPRRRRTRTVPGRRSMRADRGHRRRQLELVRRSETSSRRHGRASTSTPAGTSASRPASTSRRGLRSSARRATCCCSTPTLASRRMRSRQLVRFLHAPENVRVGCVAPATRRQRRARAARGVAVPLAVSHVDGGTWSGSRPRSSRLRHRGGASAPLGGTAARSVSSTSASSSTGRRPTGSAVPQRWVGMQRSVLMSSPSTTGLERARTRVGGSCSSTPHRRRTSGSGTGGSAGGATESLHAPERPREP